MLEGNQLLMIVVLAALFGAAQAWLTGSFWRDRHKLGLSGAGVLGFICASITFSFVVATGYELLVQKAGWTHPILVHPAEWFGAIRHWLGLTTLGIVQVPGLSSSIYGAATAGRLQRSIAQATHGLGRGARGLMGDGSLEAAGDAVGGLIETLARTPATRRGGAFSPVPKSGSSPRTGSPSSSKRSGSSSEDSGGGEAAGGIGAALLAILRWILKFLIVAAVIAIGTGIAALIMQISADYHEDRSDRLPA